MTLNLLKLLKLIILIYTHAPKNILSQMRVTTLSPDASMFFMNLLIYTLVKSIKPIKDILNITFLFILCSNSLITIFLINHHHYLVLYLQQAEENCSTRSQLT